MKVILKKILGVLFILMGSVLSLALLAQIPMTIIRIKDVGDTSEGYGFGYVIGTIIGAILIAFMAFLLFKFGFKWVSNKKKSRIEDVGSIGEN